MRGPATQHQNHYAEGACRMLAGCLALLAAAGAAHADPQDIEEGEPVTLEDAFTDPAGQLSLQYSGVFSRTHEGSAKTAIEQGPTFKLGLTPGIQISLNPGYVTGTAGEHNQGSVLGDVLVQLAGQTEVLPALAIDVFYASPFGAGHKSAATILRAIASKSLGASDAAPRLHLNLTETHLAQPDRDSRHDQLVAVFGVSFLVSRDGALVADLVHGGSEQIGQTETFLEIGYSRDLPDDWTCQLGIGRQVDGGHGTKLFFAVEKELRIF